MHPRFRTIPLPVKLAFSAFLAFHLFQHLRFYGPINYLWFCDIALLTTAIALWIESSLLLSMTAISLFGPSLLWVVDFFHKIITHRDLMGMTDYMEDPRLPIALRAASMFHLWLPILLLWCLYRTGYDRRALWCQTVFAIVILILSRTIGAPPPAHDIHQVVNINCAFGTSDAGPQTRLPAYLYLAKVIAKCFLGMYVPIHLILCACFGRARAAKRFATNPSNKADAAGGFRSRAAQS